MPPTNKQQIALFQKIIEARIEARKISPMEAILEFCSDHDLDENDIVRFISPNLKILIEKEANTKNLLKTSKSIDIYDL